MEIRVFRNLSAFAFIRCVATIPETGTHVGGASFTLQKAIDLCVSEFAERRFETLELCPKGIKPKGIAAHLTLDLARNAAEQEVAEECCIQSIYRSGEMKCVFLFESKKFSLGLARTTFGYFCFIRHSLRGIPAGTLSARKGLFRTLLKAWEEYRNVHFFKPNEYHLRRYSKPNKLFSDEQMRNLTFKFNPRFIYPVSLDHLRSGTASRSNREIFYYY